MPKSHKKRDRGDDSTATEPEPSHALPESGPVAANSGSADPKPSRADRRKAKKLRKQLERDERGTVADPVPEESSGCVVSAPGAKLAFEIQRWSTDKKQRFDFIQVEKIQDLLLWVLGKCDAADWIHVKNKALLTNLGILMVKNAGDELLRHLSPKLPFLNSQASIQTRLCRNKELLSGWNRILYLKPDPLESCAVGGPAASESEPAEPAGVAAPPPFPPSHYCLTLADRARIGFPLPSFVLGHFIEFAVPASVQATAVWGPADGGFTEPAAVTKCPRCQQWGIPEDFVCTSGAVAEFAAAFTAFHPTVTPTSPLPDCRQCNAAPPADGDSGVSGDRLLAIDCEMCKTAFGLELVRVTVVDSSHAVVYDTMVKPDNLISDYLTQFSGVSAGDLSDVTTRLPDVQAKLLSLLTPNTILVGHSLENDLKALKMFHSRLIDTCASFPHPRGPPFRSALRHLAKQHLGREIQQSDKGHCSQEDALATMELTQLKIKHGPAFADPKSQRVCEENSIVRMSHAAKLIESSTFIGPMEFLRTHMSNASHAVNVPEDSREAIIKRFTAELTADKTHKHGKRIVVAEVDGCVSPTVSMPPTAGSDTAVVSDLCEATVTAQLINLDNMLRAMQGQLLKNTVVVIVAQGPVLRSPNAILKLPDPVIAACQWGRTYIVMSNHDGGVTVAPNV